MSKAVATTIRIANGQLTIVERKSIYGSAVEYDKLGTACASR
ncbi:MULTISPECIES: hypothetical protein [Scytonema]|uniref:Uncharacterized protein n=1 Tax=Scytonema tolypothrichoides VB-61278_2 TaxID=3232314 RepID=A0ABW8X1T8_9CYAN